MRFNNKHTGNPLTFGLALTAGTGVVLMMMALAFGVVQGESADSRAIGLALVTGFVLFLLGVIGWLIVTRPFDHFDDINVPKDTGHGHSHTSTETAIVVHEETTIVPMNQH